MMMQFNQFYIVEVTLFSNRMQFRKNSINGLILWKMQLVSINLLSTVICSFEYYDGNSYICSTKWFCSGSSVSFDGRVLMKKFLKFKNGFIIFNVFELNLDVFFLIFYRLGNFQERYLNDVSSLEISAIFSSLSKS